MPQHQTEMLTVRSSLSEPAGVLPPPSCTDWFPNFPVFSIALGTILADWRQQDLAFCANCTLQAQDYSDVNRGGSALRGTPLWSFQLIATDKSLRLSIKAAIPAWMGRLSQNFITISSGPRRSCLNYTFREIWEILRHSPLSALHCVLN